MNGLASTLVVRSCVSSGMANVLSYAAGHGKGSNYIQVGQWKALL
jgi:thiol:disulfide interchange protein